MTTTAIGERMRLDIALRQAAIHHTAGEIRRFSFASLAYGQRSTCRY